MDDGADGRESVGVDPAQSLHGRTAPAHITGPYAAVIDDPDGNAVLISSDVATLNGAVAT